MTDKKILFVAQEITPYVSESPMSLIGKETPKTVQDNGWGIRAFLPKWGNINERRNQLHEVIRLSGMNIAIKDVDHPMLIKVASLASAHIQVYFIDNDDLFKKRAMLFDENGKEYADNYERSVFYCRSVIETTKLLRWYPHLVICQGWFSALVTYYLRTTYRNDPTFAQAKIVMSLYGEDVKDTLPEDMLDILALRDFTADKVAEYGLPLKTNEDLLKFCMTFCDGVVCSVPNVNPTLVEFAKSRNLPLLEYSEDDFVAKKVEFYEQFNPES